MGEFKGKVVIITGSSRGIGRDAAIAFGKEGAMLTIHGQSKEKLEETRQLLKKTGVDEKRIFSVLGPVQEEKTVQELVDGTIKKFGRIDVLINNAGIARLEGEDAASLKTFDYIFNVNVRSVIHLTQLATPHLEKSRGNVVNVSSSLAFKPLPMNAYYSMSKAALDHWTRNAANTLGEKGVRVNSVNPGVTNTEFRTRHGMPKEMEDKFAKSYSAGIILKRFGGADEIANVLVFIASSKASYITGTTIVADGGINVFVPTVDVLKGMK